MSTACRTLAEGMDSGTIGSPYNFGQQNAMNPTMRYAVKHLAHSIVSFEWIPYRKHLYLIPVFYIYMALIDYNVLYEGVPRDL